MSEPTAPFGGGTKQRDVIQMSREEIDAFLHEWHTMSCATYNHDGTIHVVAMWYGFLKDAPAFETKTKSQKALNLRRDPRITCLIEDGDSYDQLRGVELVGTAEIIEDGERLFEIAKSVLERTMGVSYEPRMKPRLDAATHKRVGVKINVERYVSWDHRKLGLPEMPKPHG